jgi:hypothetical protein
VPTLRRARGGGLMAAYKMASNRVLWLNLDFGSYRGYL